MFALWRDSSNVAHVVRALGTGVRSLDELVTLANLRAERVSAALVWLVANRHVTQTSFSGMTLWRLSDRGHDDAIDRVTAATEKRAVALST